MPRQPENGPSPRKPRGPQTIRAGSGKKVFSAFLQESAIRCLQVVTWWVMAKPRRGPQLRRALSNPPALDHGKTTVFSRGIPPSLRITATYSTAARSPSLGSTWRARPWRRSTPCA